MLSTLKLQVTRGPHAGEIIPITCMSEGNLQYRIEEASRVACVRIVGVEADEKLSDEMQAFLDEYGGEISTS